MVREVTVEGRTVPSDGEVYVIAEAGVNHNGDVDLAHRLIDAAAGAGADAVKFQTFSPEMLVSASAATAAYQRDRGGVDDQRSMLEALTLPVDAWARLRAHSRDAGITFMSSPFDLASARMLVELGVPALKLGSGELTNTPLLQGCSRLGVPLLVSTGMGTLDEARAAVEACADAPGLILFHCVSSYPTPVEACNLRALATMAQAFGVPVGWSDHTDGTTSALGAVALGAPILEKHLTLDRSMEGPDHAASLDPGQFADYVRETKLLARALGDGVKRRADVEADVAPLVRRSWHVAADRPAGHVLTADDVMLLRPEGGLAPAEAVVGRTLARDVVAGSQLVAADLAS